MENAADRLGSSLAVSCFSRSGPIPSGLDVEGEVSASEEEEDALRVAISERPHDPTYGEFCSRNLKGEAI